MAKSSALDEIRLPSPSPMHSSATNRAPRGSRYSLGRQKTVLNRPPQTIAYSLRRSIAHYWRRHTYIMDIWIYKVKDTDKHKRMKRILPDSNNKSLEALNVCTKFCHFVPFCLRQVVPPHYSVKDYRREEVDEEKNKGGRRAG